MPCFVKKDCDGPDKEKEGELGTDRQTAEISLRRCGLFWVGCSQNIQKAPVKA